MSASACLTEPAEECEIVHPLNVAGRTNICLGHRPGDTAGKIADQGVKPIQRLGGVNSEPRGKHGKAPVDALRADATMRVQYRHITDVRTAHRSADQLGAVEFCDQVQYFALRFPQ